MFSKYQDHFLWGDGGLGAIAIKVGEVCVP